MQIRIFKDGERKRHFDFEIEIIGLLERCADENKNGEIGRSSRMERKLLY